MHEKRIIRVFDAEKGQWQVLLSPVQCQFPGGYCAT